MIELQHVQFLRRPADHTPTPALPDGLRLLELGRDDLARACDPAPGLAPPRNRQRVLARFDHGLRYFLLETGRHEAVAWTWLALGAPRYVDEFCWYIDLGPGQAWVRDCHVIASHRGQRLLTHLLDAIVLHAGTPLEIFTDIETDNRASLRAHAAAGFVDLGRARAVALSAQWLLRQRPPRGLPPIDALRPDQRLLRLSPDDLAWHQAHIA